MIYCVCGYGEKVLYALDDEKYFVVGFLDSSPEIWGKNYAGKPVYPPAQLGELEYDRIIIAIAEYEEEIRESLISTYGVDKRKITAYLSHAQGIHWRDERVVALRKCIAVLRERGVRGNLAEVGVYTGEFARLFNRYLPDRKLYLFDTFEGFDAARDDFAESDAGKFKDTCVEKVLARMSHPESCVVRQGYFPDTADGLEDRFCLVSLDTDLYNPTLAGLEYFYPRLEEGGYIFVHDIGTYHYKGVKDALYRYCGEHHISFVPIADRWGSVILTR